MEHEHARHMVPVLRAGLDAIPAKVRGRRRWLVGEPIAVTRVVLPQKSVVLHGTMPVDPCPSTLRTLASCRRQCH